MSANSINSGTSALSYLTQSTQSGHHHHQLDLSNTAQLLGVSTDQLNTDLQSGTTLSSLASSAGVSSDDLLASVESDLKASAPQGAPALSDTRLAQMATNLINGTGPGSPGSGQGSSSSSSTDSTDQAQSNLTSLADALGMDPQDLLDQIQSGDSLSQLLGSSGQTGYGSSASDAIDGGLIFDQYA